jgi:large subunit ribosomal protein L6
MSRLGKTPVSIPEKVKINVSGNTVVAEGPNGKLSLEFRSEVAVAVEDNKVVVTRSSDQKQVKALHGTTRAHIANMITGVTKGFEKVLTINGVGYNAKIQGNKLVMILGFSHTVELEVPQGLKVQCPSVTSVTVSGPDCQMVGEFASKVRGSRPAEPYNLKGIKYKDEVIRRKAGKSFATGAS